MLMRSREVYSVTELMGLQEIGLDELVTSTGLEKRVVEAIVHERYTPRPLQRERVSDVLGVSREQVRWGHRALVEDHIRGPA